MSIILRGAGTIKLHAGYVQGSPDIVVTEAGVVLYEKSPGIIAALPPGRWTSIEISEIEFAPQMMPSSGPPVEPQCKMCNDSSEIVTRMIPPRCVACGRKP